MAKKRVNPAKELATTLDTWGETYGLSDDPYISGLSEALYKNRDLAEWAEIDPLEFLPHAKVPDGAFQIKWGRIISTIRNILVFAPVAITWKGVEEATIAFSKFVKTNSATTVNFLEFWQNGYGILPDAWKINNVARLDYIIVGVVILLSIFAVYFIERGRTLKHIGQARVDGDRTYLAIEIKKFLYSKRHISNVTLTDGLATVISTLENAAKSVSQATDRLDTAYKKHPSDISFRGEYKDFFNRLNKVLSKKEKP